MASQWRAGKCDATGVATHGRVDQSHVVSRTSASAIAKSVQVGRVIVAAWRVIVRRDRSPCERLTVDPSVITAARPCRCRHIARCCVPDGSPMIETVCVSLMCHCTFCRRSLSTMKFLDNRFSHVQRWWRFYVRRSCTSPLPHRWSSRMHNGISAHRKTRSLRCGK